MFAHGIIACRTLNLVCSAGFPASSCMWHIVLLGSDSTFICSQVHIGTGAASQHSPSSQSQASEPAARGASVQQRGRSHAGPPAAAAAAAAASAGRGGDAGGGSAVDIDAPAALAPAKWQGRGGSAAQPAGQARLRHGGNAGDAELESVSAAGAAIIDLTEEDDEVAGGCCRGAHLPHAAGGGASPSGRGRDGSVSGNGAWAGSGPISSGGGWACSACTLVNSEDAGRCDACAAPGPQASHHGGEAGPALGFAAAVPPPSSNSSAGGGGGGCRRGSADAGGGRPWACRFCTLQNAGTVSNCTACDQWRFSSGLPSASRPTVAQKM